ncbi:PH domain-containing protein [Shewanella algidipiscicola]|uniref:PH domain-containing protein n=1 Tax=Shewanella algidipiscicola TaxID=614070 RepID=UPI000D7859D8|nr:PH domain-containing protein [Shewanella algidipiscicola]
MADDLKDPTLSLGERQRLAPNEWLSFDQVPLTPVESTYIEQVHIENLLLFVPIIIAIAVIGILVNLPILALLGLVTAALVLAALISYGRYKVAQSLAYGVFDYEFVMQQGVIWQQKIALPYSRLQHVSLSQGPLERRFGQHTLKCFSAGSGSAEITLPGLSSSVAESLRQHLLAKAALVRQASSAPSDIEAQASLNSDNLTDTTKLASQPNAPSDPATPSDKHE